MRNFNATIALFGKGLHLLGTRMMPVLLESLLSKLRFEN
jgi:hypothetical protein